MTILNAVVRPGQVLLSVDSNSRTPISANSKTTKIFPLPHLKAIIAGTGTIALAPLLQMTLLDVSDFDTAIKDLASMISGLWSKIIGHHLGQSRQGIFVAGYSNASGRFIGRWAQQECEAQGFQVTSIDAGVSELILSPWEGESPAHPSTCADLIEIARRQYKMWHAKRPDAAFGGELIVAQLTKNAVRLEAVWDLCRDSPTLPIGRLCKGADTND